MYIEKAGWVSYFTDTFIIRLQCWMRLCGNNLPNVLCFFKVKVQEMFNRFSRLDEVVIKYRHTNVAMDNPLGTRHIKINVN